MLDIKDWTDALKGGLPPVKLPKYVFGTAGCYSFMEEKLRPILEYEDLKAGVFQASAVMPLLLCDARRDEMEWNAVVTYICRYVVKYDKICLRQWAFGQSASACNPGGVCKGGCFEPGTTRSSPAYGGQIIFFFFSQKVKVPPFDLQDSRACSASPKSPSIFAAGTYI